MLRTFHCMCTHLCLVHVCTYTNLHQKCCGSSLLSSELEFKFQHNTQNLFRINIFNPKLFGPTSFETNNLFFASNSFMLKKNFQPKQFLNHKFVLQIFFSGPRLFVNQIFFVQLQTEAKKQEQDLTLSSQVTITNNNNNNKNHQLIPNLSLTLKTKSCLEGKQRAFEWL